MKLKIGGWCITVEPCRQCKARGGDPVWFDYHAIHRGVPSVDLELRGHLQAPADGITEEWVREILVTALGLAQIEPCNPDFKSPPQPPTEAIEP